MKKIVQNPETQYEYTNKLPDVVLFEDAEEILVEPGDILISTEAAFDDILEKFSEHSEKFLGAYMSPREILEEMQGYV
jgi:hypothetical protein